MPKHPRPKRFNAHEDGVRTCSAPYPDDLGQRRGRGSWLPTSGRAQYCPSQTHPGASLLTMYLDLVGGTSGGSTCVRSRLLAQSRSAPPRPLTESRGYAMNELFEGGRRSCCVDPTLQHCHRGELVLQGSMYDFVRGKTDHNSGISFALHDFDLSAAALVSNHRYYILHACSI